MDPTRFIGLILIASFGVIISVNSYKKAYRQYELAKMNLDSMGDRVVDAKIVDINLADNSDGGVTRTLTYEFVAPNGEEYSHDVVSETPRHIGDVDKVLLIVDDDGDYCDIEKVKMPKKPSIDAMVANVVQLLMMLAFAFLLLR